MKRFLYQDFDIDAQPSITDEPADPEPIDVEAKAVTVHRRPWFVRSVPVPRWQLFVMLWLMGMWAPDLYLRAEGIVIPTPVTFVMLSCAGLVILLLVIPRIFANDAKR